MSDKIIADLKKQSLPVPEGTKLKAQEAHDLSMLIKERTKVLKHHVEEQAARLLADFEREMAAIYKFDDNEIWKAAAEKARGACHAAQKAVEKECERLGIPKNFAPSIDAVWTGRGENALANRRVELRRVAKTAIDAMVKAAITKIEHQGLDLRTQIVAMCVLSPDARLFLESLSPVSESMQSIRFADIEARFEAEKTKRIKDYRHAGYYE